MYKRVQEPGVMLRLTEGGRADREGKTDTTKLKAQVGSDSFLLTLLQTLLHKVKREKQQRCVCHGKRATCG